MSKKNVSEKPVVNATTASLIRRAFGKMSQEKAVEAFLGCLNELGTQEDVILVDTAVRELFAKHEGATMKKEEIRFGVALILGDQIESEKALNRLLPEVLALPHYVGKRGAIGSGYRLVQALFESPAPAPTETATEGV